MIESVLAVKTAFDLLATKANADTLTKKADSLCAKMKADASMQHVALSGDKAALQMDGSKYQPMEGCADLRSKAFILAMDHYTLSWHPNAYPLPGFEGFLKAQTHRCFIAVFSIVDLRKVYGSGRLKRVAVDNLNLSFYNSQISCLLGHNGAFFDRYAHSAQRA